MAGRTAEKTRQADIVSSKKGRIGFRMFVEKCIRMPQGQLRGRQTSITQSKAVSNWDVIWLKLFLGGGALPALRHPKTFAAFFKQPALLLHCNP